MLVGCDGTEDNLSEALSGKHPKTDASNDAAIFNEGEGFVLPVNILETLKVWDEVTCDLTTSTYGSNTSRVMYSLGIRGN